ncbi:hypothetical protein M1328_01070 [Patescibacteria group bacterium]|nr:hypothetical protein [Patescibacteria group bacterium]
MQEYYRNGNEALKRQLGLLRLRFLLTKDSLTSDIPNRQRVFFRSLAAPANFKLLPENMGIAKMIGSSGNRYRLYSSFLYSMLKSDEGKRFLGGRNPSLFNPDFSSWNSIINTLLSSDKFSEVFSQTTLINQQAIYPESVPSIRIIINKLFPRDKNLIVYDFGCGQNFDLPAMAAEKTAIDNDFSAPYELRKYDRRISLGKGIGVDSNAADDIDWTKICTCQHYKDLNMVMNKIAAIDELTKMRDSAGNVERVKESVLDFKPGQQGDVVITKWMRYQIDDQKLIMDAVLRTLNEGGYWISVGEEEKLKARREGKKYDFRSDQIWVWQKKGDRLVPISSNPKKPRQLMTISKGKIVNFDKKFFTYSSK